MYSYFKQMLKIVFKRQSGYLVTYDSQAVIIFHKSSLSLAVLNIMDTFVYLYLLPLSIHFYLKLSPKMVLSFQGKAGLISNESDVCDFSTHTLGISL